MYRLSCAESENANKTKTNDRTLLPDTIRFNRDRKSTRLNSSHVKISYAVFCLNATATTAMYTLSLHDALPILTCATLNGTRTKKLGRIAYVVGCTLLILKEYHVSTVLRRK